MERPEMKDNLRPASISQDTVGYHGNKSIFVIVLFFLDMLSCH